MFAAFFSCHAEKSLTFRAVCDILFIGSKNLPFLSSLIWQKRCRAFAFFFCTSIISQKRLFVKCYLKTIQTKGQILSKGCFFLAPKRESGKPPPPPGGQSGATDAEGAAPGRAEPAEGRSAPGWGGRGAAKFYRVGGGGGNQNRTNVLQRKSGLFPMLSTLFPCCIV